MVQVKAPNELADCGLPIAYAAAMSAPDGVPDVGSFNTAFRTTVRSLTEMQKEAIVASTRSKQVWRLASDEGPYLNGHDFAPAPLAYLTAGLAADHINALGRAVGRLDGIELEFNTYFSMSGSMRKRDMMGAAHNPLVRVGGPAAGLGLAGILDAVVAAPSSGLIRGTRSSEFTLTADGHVIDVSGVAALDGPAMPDPGPNPLQPPLDELMFLEEVVTKTIDVEDKPPREGATGVGGSLAESQQRRLHLQANCTVRPDGVKEIEVHVHNPNGSTFRFLSDEPGDDGVGRAPDAGTLISAGIGFCFMTQFGRFAKIVGRGLGPYHIVQDTRFSAGDPTTLTPGRAAPVGTHVYVETDGDDEFAREAVLMSEQTCFLHALCRTDLRTKISGSGGLHLGAA